MSVIIILGALATSVFCGMGIYFLWRVEQDMPELPETKKEIKEFKRERGYW